MSTSENTPLPDDALGTSPVPAHRSALLGLQETGWTGVSEYAGPAEPHVPTTSPSAYLHGLRRHWVLATFLGVVMAGTAALAVWYGWGSQYTASAYFRIRMTEEPLVFPRPGGNSDRFTQSAFDIYKDTQRVLVTSGEVIATALDKTVLVNGQEMKAGNLPAVKREDYPPGAAVVWLQNELDVSFPGDAEIMEISLTGKDKEVVTALVNAVVDAYKLRVLDEEEHAQIERLKELDSAHARTRENLRSKEKERSNLVKAVNANDPETLRVRQQMELRQVNDLQGLHSQALIALEHAQRDLDIQETLLNKVNTVPIPRLDVENYVNMNPRIRQLAAELTSQLMARNQTRSFASPGSSSAHAEKYDADIQMIEGEIAALEEGVSDKIREKNRIEIEAKIDELRIQVEASKAQENRLAKELKAQEDQLKMLSAKSIDLQILQGEIDRLDLVVDTVDAQRAKLKVEQSSKQRRVEKLRDAQVPSTESKRGVRIALTVLAAIMGLCAPIACVTWWDTRAQRINSPTDVSRKLGLTVLGSIPTVPARTIRQLGSPSKRHRTWHLRLTESVDGITARLLRQAEANQTRVILISSAASGEGKTTLATQLAMSLARNGRRTALVDFDLRRPAFDKVLGLPLEPGISEVLRGQSDASEVVHQTSTNNLHVVTAGRWDRSALTALANGAAGQVFDALRAEYEFVVVDAAPILPVADTRFVSQHVDTVILSVFRDISRAPKISAACEILEAFGVENVEAVVTGTTDNLRDRDLRYEAAGLST